MMMMYMAWPAEQGRRRINLTAEASRSMDGWMDGWMGREGNTGLNKRPPEKSSAARILVTFTISTPARDCGRGRPPLPGVPSTRCNHPQKAYQVQHKRAHSHIRTQSHVLPGCDQRATNVQAQYNDTQGPFIVARSIVAARSTSTNDTVGRAENFCLGRLHLHRARPRRPLSLNLTTHGLLLLLLRLLLLLYGEPASLSLSYCSVGLAVGLSVLSASVVVPTTYTAKSSVPPPPP